MRVRGPMSHMIYLLSGLLPSTEAICCEDEAQTYQIYTPQNQEDFRHSSNVQNFGWQEWQKNSVPRHQLLAKRSHAVFVASASTMTMTFISGAGVDT